MSINRKSIQGNLIYQHYDIKYLEEAYINLLDLVNKKSEKLSQIKKNKKLIDIMENNDIKTLLKNFDIISKNNKINISKEKNEIRIILYTLTSETRIKKLICSILWITDNFNKYIKFKLTPFNDFIKNIYKAFEKRTITISILIDCINFLKSKNILEEDIPNINKDLFIDFLILINNQIK